MRLRKMDDPLLVQSAGILERQVRHVVHLVDDLMDMARLERGKVTLRRERVDLNRVVAAAADSCAPQAKAHGHRIALELCADALPVDADAVRLEQVVCNLVNNALKFTREPGEIRIVTQRRGGEALVAVEDPGVGFEPEVAEKIFTPFLQAHPTLERSAGGLGIGLTIVQRLVELHGGSVGAASEGRGKGARFVVRLPLVEGRAPEARPAGEAAPREGGRGPRRIVVIEDNEDIRESLRTLLTLWGHHVEIAADGASGLERVLRERPDVALVDIGLPGLSGYDVARAIRAQACGDAIRLIAVTGYGQPADRERALAAGFDAHVLKPISPDALARELALAR
jgi:CheY-like chemotaxis protein